MYQQGISLTVRELIFEKLKMIILRSVRNFADSLFEEIGKLGAIVKRSRFLSIKQLIIVRNYSGRYASHYEEQSRPDFGQIVLQKRIGEGLSDGRKRDGHFL